MISALQRIRVPLSAPPSSKLVATAIFAPIRLPFARRAACSGGRRSWSSNRSGSEGPLPSGDDTVAVHRSGLSTSTRSTPGTMPASSSGSVSASNTASGGAAKVRSPSILMPAASPSTRLAKRADQRAAGDDERRTEDELPPDELGPSQDERREQDAPEGLGRDERRDDGHPAAVVGLEQAGVREPEGEARGEERDERASALRQRRGADG